MHVWILSELHGLHDLGKRDNTVLVWRRRALRSEFVTGFDELHDLGKRRG